jgi:hypothetical protein
MTIEFPHKAPEGYYYETDGMLLQSGFIIIAGLITILAAMFAVSGDSTTPKPKNTSHPLIVKPLVSV